MTTTVSPGSSTSFTIGPFGTIRVTASPASTGTISFTAGSLSDLRSDVTSNISNRVYGPFGVPGTITVTVGSGVVSYTISDVGLDAAGESIGTYYAPRSTGNDQTSELQELFSDTYSDIGANAGLRVRPLIVFPDDVYYVNGLTLEQSIRYNFGGAQFLKTEDGTGAYDSAYNSVIRTRLEQTGGSWFGQADDIEIIGGTFDCNDKQTPSGIVNFLNVRNFIARDVTAVHATLPYKGGFGWHIGGDNIELFNPGVRQGDFVGHDGIHVFFCRKFTSHGGYSEGGDDAIAFGMEPWMEAWCDDIGLENYQVFGLRCRSMRTAAVKCYVPTAGVSSGSNRGKHRGGRVFATGVSGLKRGGGVFIQNEDTTAPDVTMIQDVEVTFDGTIGSADYTHDGQSAYGVQVYNCTNVGVYGNLKFVDMSGSTKGFQRILANGPLGTSLTGLTPATTYDFSVVVDGGAPITVNVLGSSAQTWADLYTTIAADAGLAAVANVEWWGNSSPIVIISKTTGASSTVAITAGTLFTGATPNTFTSIETAVAGIANKRFDLANLATVSHLRTNINCMNVPGGEGYIFSNCTRWRVWGHLEGVASGKFALKAAVGGTSTTMDASGMVVRSASGGGFCDPNTGRVQVFRMFGGDVTDCTVKFNVSNPATAYAISGVLGVSSIVGGTAQITAGNTETTVTINCTPRLHYSAGSPLRSLQQIKVVNTTAGAPAFNLAEVDNNSFKIQLGGAAAGTYTYSWQVNSGFSGT